MLIGHKIFSYQELDSTSDQAKRLVKQGAQEGTVVLAESQTKGRGKPGSQWFSAPKLGLYFSVILKPRKNPNDLASITLIGARAVVTAIETIFGLKATIKQPNDVLLNGKKIAGVLVERIASGEIIIGIGVNLNHQKENFPFELQAVATSLKIETGKNIDQESFSSLLLRELQREYLAYLN